MEEIFDDYSFEVSPQGVIESVLLGSEALEDNQLWFCLTCDLCTDICPEEVRFGDFIEAARQIILEAGVTEQAVFCRRCGTYLCPQHTMEYVIKKVGEVAEELLTLCPGCRQYEFGEKVKSLSLRKRRTHVQHVGKKEIR
jgi:heterodisulfide reductase subunit C